MGKVKLRFANLYEWSGNVNCCLFQVSLGLVPGESWASYEDMHDFSQSYSEKFICRCQE